MSRDKLVRWQGLIAFGPFALITFLAQTELFGRLASWLFMTITIAAIGWAVIFEGYLLYLKYQE